MRSHTKRQAWSHINNWKAIYSKSLIRISDLIEANPYHKRFMSGMKDIVGANDDLLNFVSLGQQTVIWAKDLPDDLTQLEQVRDDLEEATKQELLDLQKLSSQKAGALHHAALDPLHKRIAAIVKNKRTIIEIIIEIKIHEMNKINAPVQTDDHDILGTASEQSVVRPAEAIKSCPQVDQLNKARKAEIDQLKEKRPLKDSTNTRNASDTFGKNRIFSGQTVVHMRTGRALSITPRAWSHTLHNGFMSQHGFPIAV